MDIVDELRKSTCVPEDYRRRAADEIERLRKADAWMRLTLPEYEEEIERLRKAYESWKDCYNAADANRDEWMAKCDKLADENERLRATLYQISLMPVYATGWGELALRALTPPAADSASPDSASGIPAPASPAVATGRTKEESRRS